MGMDSEVLVTWILIFITMKKICQLQYSFVDGAKPLTMNGFIAIEIFYALLKDQIFQLSNISFYVEKRF